MNNIFEIKREQNRSEALKYCAFVTVEGTISFGFGGLSSLAKWETGGKTIKIFGKVKEINVKEFIAQSFISDVLKTYNLVNQFN